MSPRLAKILIGGIAVLVAITLAIVAFVPDIEVRFTETEAQDAIEERLPLIMDYDNYRLDVTDVEVDFQGRGEKGRVAIFSAFKIEGLGLAGSGNIETTSRVRYDDGAFYLSDLLLDDFEITPSLASRAKLAAWKKLMDTFIDQVEADLEEQGDREALAKFADLKAQIGPVVRAALNRRMGEIPVYRLKGSAANNAARLVLKDVAFTDTEAIAILSPAQAMIKIATAVIGLLLGGLFFLDWWRTTSARARLTHTN